jgi:hypothetical protein
MPASPTARHSVPAPSTVIAAATKNDQNDEQDQKGSGIHGSLLKEIEPSNLARLNFLVLNADQEERFLVVLLAFLASHLVPLLAEIFFDRVHFPRCLVLHRDEGGTC